MIGFNIYFIFICLVDQVLIHYVQWSTAKIFCGAVGWGTELQVGRSWVRFPVVSLEFFIDIILLAALWPWGWLSL